MIKNQNFTFTNQFKINTEIIDIVNFNLCSVCFSVPYVILLKQSGFVDCPNQHGPSVVVRPLDHHHLLTPAEREPHYLCQHYSLAHFFHFSLYSWLFTFIGIYFDAFQILTHLFNSYNQTNWAGHCRRISRVLWRFNRINKENKETEGGWVKTAKSAGVVWRKLWEKGERSREKVHFSVPIISWGAECWSGTWSTSSSCRDFVDASLNDPYTTYLIDIIRINTFTWALKYWLNQRSLNLDKIIDNLSVCSKLSIKF